MSNDAFSVTPAPAAAEDLDVEYTEDPNAKTKSERKFWCKAGTYNAMVSAMKKYPADPNREDSVDRLRIEVTLLDDACTEKAEDGTVTTFSVKGIKASRFYDLAGEFVWVLEQAVKAFGVVPVDLGNGKKKLPLKDNYTKIMGGLCRAQVKPRQVGDKVFMDVERLYPADPAPAAGSNDVPF